MKQLSSLIREYADKNDKSILGKRNDSVVIAKEPIQVPIFVNHKWETVGSPKSLYKEFLFQNKETRARFVANVMTYEISIGHFAAMTIVENSVTLTVKTHKIDVVTELDREYARYVDLIFKDIVYTPIHDAAE